MGTPAFGSPICRRSRGRSRAWPSGFPQPYPVSCLVHAARRSPERCLAAVRQGSRAAQLERAEPHHAWPPIRPGASTVLLYFDRGEKRYVVASFAGTGRQPAWYLNALADQHVTCEVQDQLTHCVARAVAEEEAAELWPFLDKMYPGFRRYRRRTARQLPIVELGPDPVAAG